jgi:hypothetical protein
MRLGALAGLSGLLVVAAVIGATDVVRADYESTVLGLDPIGYWRLNETDGDTAENLGSAGSDLNGLYNFGVQGVDGPDALADGTPLPGLGAGNLAYEVGPDDSFLSTEESPLSGLGEFTVAGWVRPGPRDSDRIGLFGQNDAIEFGFINPNQIQLWTPGGGTLNWPFSPDTDIQEDSWYHIVGVGTGTQLRLYVNGALVQNAPNYGTSTYNFNIGGGGVYDATGNQFEGGLDEIAIYDVALSDEQIMAQYDAAMSPTGDYESTVLSTGPIGYWRLNETQGDSAANFASTGEALNGLYNAGEQGMPGPDAPGLGANNVAYVVGPDESFVGVEASPLSNLGEFTLSGWVQAEPLLNDRTGLWGQNDAMEFGFINPTTIQMWTPGGGALNWDIGLDPDAADIIEGGEWFHLAAVGDGEEIRLYFNGEFVEAGGSPVSVDTDNYGDSSFFFNAGGGGVYDATGNQLTGVIDEIAIWDIALTTQQVQEMFNAALEGGAPMLQAGDADQNLQFDQLDLVKVQVAAKYLTGQPATWGEGDWNGAPGGTVGAPPPGDNRFDQLDIVAALSNNLYLAGPYAAAPGGVAAAADQVSLVPEPSSVVLTCLGLVALVGCAWRRRRHG